MWIFPGADFNIIESGYSNIDPLFIVAPWVFLFLIPAVTMKMFAEEQKSGTIEISYIGLVFLCSGFASIGVFASALSNNQIVSFILAVILSFFFYSGFEFLGSIITQPTISNLLAQLGISSHYGSMSRGVIDSRDVIYFISLTLFFVFFTRFILEKRKW